MRSIWRVLLLWLTVLAMPIQGIASIGMLHCASDSAQTHSHVQEQVSTDGHAHAHAGAVVNTALQELSDDGVEGKADGATTHEAESSPAGHKCSACAACCPGAALPASATQWPAPEVSSAPQFASTAASVSFIASGLERPPRHPLA